MQRVWTADSYPDIGRTFLTMAAHLVETAGVDADDRVLDVACGTGNVAITPARRDATVAGLDTVLQRALSPAHYWQYVRTQSGLFIVALENVPDEDHPALDDEMVDAVTPYFDDTTNTVAMTYRLTTARVD